ncbi:MAG: ferric reductase-like transmembrane domain-containing protein [Candidatus Andersenbacteria bacterium]
MTWLYRWIRALVYGLAVLWSILLVGWTLAKLPAFSPAVAELGRNFGLSALIWLLATYIPGLLSVAAPRGQLTALLVRARRAIGLTSLLFVLVHVAIAFFFAFHGSFVTIGRLSYPYSLSIALGTVALVGLIALGLTANDWAVRKLGKRWKQLHRLTYLFTPAALLHVIYIGSDFIDTRRPLALSIIVSAIMLTLLKVWASIVQLRRRTVQPSAVQAAAEKALLVLLVAAALYLGYASLISGTIGHKHGL